MSRKLSQLQPDQRNLMDHIADFICKTTNITTRHITEHTIDIHKGVRQYLCNFWSQIFQTKHVDCDKDGNTTYFETVDGYIPLLTNEEIQALKLFLADYKSQLKINH